MSTVAPPAYLALFFLGALRGLGGLYVPLLLHGTQHSPMFAQPIRREENEESPVAKTSALKKSATLTSSASTSRRSPPPPKTTPSWTRIAWFSAFNTLFYGAYGVLVRPYYEMLSYFCGEGTDLGTALSKCAMDLFVFSFWIVYPAVMIAIMFRNNFEMQQDCPGECDVMRRHLFPSRAKMERLGDEKKNFGMISSVTTQFHEEPLHEELPRPPSAISEQPLHEALFLLEEPFGPLTLREVEPSSPRMFFICTLPPSSRIFLIRPHNTSCTHLPRIFCPTGSRPIEERREVQKMCKRCVKRCGKMCGKMRTTTITLNKHLPPIVPQKSTKVRLGIAREQRRE